jgi:hypothetical protein
MRSLSAGIPASPRMTPVPARVLVTFVLLAACLGRAGAQPVLHTVVSVDAAVLNAEYVFVGRIERLLPDGATTSAANVAARVETRLKGEVSDVTQTLIAAPESSLADWRTRGSRLLFIHGAEPIDLSASNLMVFTAQSAVLRQPEQVIQAARDAIRQHPGVTRINTCLRPIPSDVAKKNKLFGFVALVVPTDEALERWALRGLRSKDPHDRSAAVEVLRHYRSDANVSRLKALLADPGFVLSPGPGDKRRKFHIVRKTAYDTLIAWGQKPEKPEFYKETPDLPGDAREQKAGDRESGLREAAPNKSLETNCR